LAHGAGVGKPLPLCMRQGVKCCAFPPALELKRQMVRAGCGLTTMFLAALARFRSRRECR